MPPAKNVIPDRQLAWLAGYAGWKGDEIPKAVAIALGESGGNASAHNPNPPDNSYGLWQINMIGDLGPARRQEFGIKSNDDLFRPGTNATAAYKVYRDAGGSFRPWSVYTNGTWVTYMGRARAAARNPVGMSPSELARPGGYGPSRQSDRPDPIGSITDAIGNITNVFEFISKGENWIRVAGFVGGGALVLFGLVAVAKQTGIADDLVKAVPVARAARKVI